MKPCQGRWPSRSHSLGQGRRVSAYTPPNLVACRRRCGGIGQGGRAITVAVPSRKALPSGSAAQEISTTAAGTIHPPRPNSKSEKITQRQASYASCESHSVTPASAWTLLQCRGRGARRRHRILCKGPCDTGQGAQRGAAGIPSRALLHWAPAAIRKTKSGRVTACQGSIVGWCIGNMVNNSRFPQDSDATIKTKRCSRADVSGEERAALHFYCACSRPPSSHPLSQIHFYPAQNGLFYLG